MEEDLKILKVKYLSNHLLDHTQILNLSLDYQTIFYKSLKWKRPPMEDNLKWKKNSNGRRPQMEDDLQWKTTSNGRQPHNIKSAISQPPAIWLYSNFRLQLIWPRKTTSCAKLISKMLEYDFWVLRGKLVENSEEISSVALLSPAC
jgi:hypothetical protein